MMADEKNPGTTANRHTDEDARLYSPSTARNKAPLLDALQSEMPGSTSVLEIASGSGEHGVHFCTSLPQIQWHPSDISEEALASIAAWRAVTGLVNLAVPLTLNVAQDKWWEQVSGPIDIILSCNMIHISPWAAGKGLIKGAGALLTEGGLLALYGPFSKGGVHSASSNEDFDRSLKSRDPSWGVRDIDDISEEAAKAGLTLEREIQMPANNKVLLYRRGGS